HRRAPRALPSFPTRRSSDLAPASAGSPVRLTRSPEGETNPRFLPDGSLLFISKRPGQHAGDPDWPGSPGGPAGREGPGAPADDQPGLWLLPAAGGEAVRVADRPGGISA